MSKALIMGLYVYFENLRKARSWFSNDMLSLLSSEDVHSFNWDYCRYAKLGRSEGVEPMLLPNVVPNVPSVFRTF